MRLPHLGLLILIGYLSSCDGKLRLKKAGGKEDKRNAATTEDTCQESETLNEDLVCETTKEEATKAKILDDNSVPDTKTFTVSALSTSQVNPTIDAGSTATIEFTIKNTGDLALKYEATSVSTILAHEFTGGSFPGSAGNCAIDLAVGKSCKLQITFAPLVSGSYNADLSITYSAVTNSTALGGTAKGGILLANFGTAGVVYGQSGTDFSTLAISAGSASGNNIYAAGNVDADFLIFGYDSTGTPISTFGSNGVAIYDAGTTSDKLQDIEIMSDGSLALASYKVGSNWKFITTIFDDEGDIVGDVVTSKNLSRNFSVGLDRNDNMILAGRLDTTSPKSLIIGKANNLGVIDTSFGSSGYIEDPFAIGGAYSIGYATEVYKAGNHIDKFIVAGLIDLTGSNDDFFVARFNADGSLDTDFNTIGYRIFDLAGEDDRAVDLEIDPASGNIAIAGKASFAGEIDSVLIVVDANGNPVSDFADNGIYRSNLVGADDSVSVINHHTGGWMMAVTHDGKCKALHLANNGSLVSGFGTEGIFTATFNSIDAACKEIVIHSDGQSSLIASGTKTGESGKQVMITRFRP
jgi:hypothetical protein